MQTVSEVLQKTTVKGTVVFLPPVQLDKKLYQDVAKHLNLIGGTWKGGKTMGFVFNEDPTNLLAEVATGKRKDIKKDFQFFPTPSHLAKRLVELAEIEEYDMVLEPSAGQGAIIKAIQEQHNVTVNYCELMPLNREFLKKFNNVNYLTDNFLKLPQSKTVKGLFHKIIANPPFNKNQDIDHIRAMYDVAAEGGRIVTIASKHWQISGNKTETNFRKWLKDVDAEIIEIDRNEFKESGTSIPTVIIIINK